MSILIYPKLHKLYNNVIVSIDSLLQGLKIENKVLKNYLVSRLLKSNLDCDGYVKYRKGVFLKTKDSKSLDFESLSVEEYNNIPELNFTLRYTYTSENDIKANLYFDIVYESDLVIGKGLTLENPKYSYSTDELLNHYQTIVAFVKANNKADKLLQKVKHSITTTEQSRSKRLSL
jgi:hypothetical protein